MKKIILIAAMALGLSACTDPDGARRALESNGFTDIDTKGYSFFGCGKDDQFSTEFTAKTINKTQVNGVVCSGFFKGSTIRTY